MFSILVAAWLTTVHFARINAGSPPSLPGWIGCYGTDERLRVSSYSADNAEFYVMSVYHATYGYINSALTTSTSGVYIATGKCGRNYNLTVTAFNRYGSSQPKTLRVSSGTAAPYIRKPLKIGLSASIEWTNRCAARHDLNIVNQNLTEHRVTSVHSPYTLEMQPNMLYTVKVIAVYETGESASSIKNITTGWVGNVESISVVPTLRSSHLTWSVAEYADLYLINVSLKEDTVFHTNVNKSIKTLELHDLKAGKRYEISIKPINKHGEGAIHTQSFNTVSDVPLIQRVNITQNRTARVEWTQAKDNKNYSLYIMDINGTSYFEGQVASSVYTWKANSSLVNVYAYVITQDYDSNQKSNCFYFGNAAASRPVITSVVQTSHYQLRVSATAIDNGATYGFRINVYTSYIDSNGNPRFQSRSNPHSGTSPWVTSLSYTSGTNYIYYVTVFVDNDGDSNYETSSDTFVHKAEPPPAVPSLSQFYYSSNFVGITWSVPNGYVEKYWVIATAVTGGETVKNTSITGTHIYIYGLKPGRYYSATVTAENPAGRGPPRNITVKTAMDRAYVSEVAQVRPYMARIHVHLAPDAIKHVLFIDNNRTKEQKTITSLNNSVIHKLAGSLELRIKIVAIYKTGNISSTEIFPGECEAGSCVGNASCTLDESYKPICFCKRYFKGDGRTGCFPFCRSQQVGDYNFTTVPAGQVAYSEEKCASSRSNASVLCKIQKHGSEFRTFFDYLNSIDIDCDFELRNITSETNAMTEDGAERLCRIFEVTTSKVSLIKYDDAKEILDYLEKLAESNARMSTQGLKQCLLTASHLTSYLRARGDREGAEKMLRTLPLLFRHLNVDQYNDKSRDFTWTSDIIFAQVTDVPTHLARVEKGENYSIYSEFLSLDGTGRPEHPVEMIVPLASVASVHEQMSQETECSLSAIRIVFLAYRDLNFISKSSSSDWITFLKMGTTKRPGKMNANQKVLIRKYLSNPDNSSQSTPLSDFYCGALDAKTFRWKKRVCSAARGETEECECHQLGYYEILKKSAFPPPVPYQMQNSDVAGCAVIVASMIFTSFFLLTEKKLRMQYDIQALLHVFFTSSISHIVYVYGISNTTPVAACVAVTWLLHFFVLCSWTWVFVLVYTTYAFMKVKSSIGYKSAYIGTALTYAVPFCVIIVNGCITLVTSTTSQGEQAAGLYDVCFVQGYSLYFAFIFPAAVEFLLILHSCVCIWRLMKKDGKFLRRRLLFSVVWPFTTLISWTSAFTAAFTANSAAKWIFFAMNIIQAIALALSNRYAWKETQENAANNRPCPSTNSNAENRMMNRQGEYSPAREQVNENHAYEDVDIYENVRPFGTRM